MHGNMSDIGRVYFVRILFPENQPNEEPVLLVSGHFATINSPAQNSPPLKVKSPPVAT